MKNPYWHLNLMLVLLTGLGVAEPCLGGQLMLEEITRYSGFDDDFRGVTFLNGRMFVLQEDGSGESRIVERDPTNPAIVLASFDTGISGFGMGLAGDNASGFLYATWTEEDGDGLSAVYRIDPELHTVVEAYSVETGQPWNNIGGLSIAGDRLYGAATDGPRGPFAEIIYEYDLSTGTTLRSRNIDFLGGSNFTSIEVIDNTAVAIINHGSIDSGELHSFDVSDLSYVGSEEHSGLWVSGSGFDGTYLWLAELTRFSFSGPVEFELDLVKYAIPEPNAAVMLSLGVVLAFGGRRRQFVGLDRNSGDYVTHSDGPPGEGSG